MYKSNTRPNSLFRFQVSSIVSSEFQRNKDLQVFGVEILPMSLGIFQHKLWTSLSRMFTNKCSLVVLIRRLSSGDTLLVTWRLVALQEQPPSALSTPWISLEPGRTENYINYVYLTGKNNLACLLYLWKLSLCVLENDIVFKISGLNKWAATYIK